MKPFRSSCLFAMLICFILGGVEMASGTEEQIKKVQHVLLLNSYHQNMTWVSDIVRGVSDAMQAGKNNLSLHIENMDSKMFFSSEYFEVYREYLRVKYRNIQLSLILSSDNNAYDFLRVQRDTLFPGVPVSFCGVNNFHASQLSGLEKFTGVAEIFSSLDTVELALKNHPEATELFVINDYLKTGRAWSKDIDIELQSLSRKVRIRHSGDLSFAALQKEIANLPSSAVILLGVYFADKDGLYLTYERIGALLSAVSKVPVYCLLEFNIGNGVVGGRVISGYFQGKRMAEIGFIILNGEDPASIPVKTEGSNRYVFDYRQLERFGLKEYSLPANSHIVNRPYSFYQEYRAQVWMIVCFIITLLVTIFILLVNTERRKRAEVALLGSEKRFRQIANATWEAIVVHDKGYFFHGNDPFYALFRYTASELAGKQILPMIIVADQIHVVTKRIDSGDLEAYETIARDKYGHTFPVEIRVREMEYEGRDVRMAAIRDLTGRKKMEQQISESQKLEAVGILAGGIAHDFNNILSAIIGYTELSLMSVDDTIKVRKNLGEMLKAGNRAKDLVQQILTFARKSSDQKEPVQVSLVIVEALKLLRATLPASITIEQKINSNANVFGDTTQIHQVVMNLCTNAGRAMKDGGQLTVTLSEVDLDQHFILNHFGATAGRHLQLTVSDTGVGIPQELLSQIFDPFFTTRAHGEGTGLGLSVVHGIIKDSHGIITVSSEPGKGCEFDIFLPIVDSELSDLVRIDRNLPHGNERILLVDDEEVLVSMTNDILTNLGYSVLCFTESTKAIEAFSSDPDSFDLVISDMTMPVMTGDKLASEILAIRSDTPIILTTGYTEHVTETEALERGIKRFVLKPVSLSRLAVTIREVLEGR